MQLSKYLKFSFVVIGLMFWLGASFAAAEESKTDNTVQLKELQQQQEKMRLEYEQNKKNLQAELKKVLTDYKKEPGKPTRQDIVKENNEKQEKLRAAFQEEVRKLQAQERKIRLGRESLERPNLGGIQAKVYQEGMNDKEKRLDLQRRRAEQDKILQRDRATEHNEQRFNPPPSEPVPDSSETQETPSKRIDFGRY